MTGTNSDGYAGQQQVSAAASDYNVTYFIVQQILGRCSFMKLVQVVGVSGGGVAPVGFVNVKPMVNLVDGAGNSSEHGIVYNLPYTRLQGGDSAVIIDPKVGDIGWACCADRDGSVVKSTRAPGNPGSQRRYSLSDAVYLGGILNAAPMQYVFFTEAGIEIRDRNDNAIVMGATGITINGVLFDAAGNISGAGTVDAAGEGTFDGHTVGAHTHGGIQPGSGSTDPPTG
ncbi:MAG: hypothetical protein GC190_19325 [Alphaproteobacteria bacterium]|nr:hypothetical protein [Alphaproteobacteria bacterium]